MAQISNANEYKSVKKDRTPKYLRFQMIQKEI